MSKTPTILKKDASQRPARPQSHQPIQPKILTKSVNKENVTSTNLTTPAVKQRIVEVVETPTAPQIMKGSKRLITPHFQLDVKLLDYLDNENTDFLVVAAIGVSKVGKSTLSNIIANPNYLTISQDASSVTFQKKHEVFPVSGVVYEGNTIDMFITLDRIIFLDTSPLFSNVQRRDMMVSECDDIKTLAMLLQLCHLVLVVNDGFPNYSVTRLLSVAEHMVPNDMKHRPVLAYIGNRIQPGTQMMKLDARVHDGANLQVPDLNHPGVSLHYDVHQVVQELQEKVFMMKRWSMMDSEEEIFTEKKWGQRVVQVLDQMKNDFFLRKYEALRDKFHQAVENC